MGAAAAGARRRGRGNPGRCGSSREARRAARAQWWEPGRRERRHLMIRDSVIATPSANSAARASAQLMSKSARTSRISCRRCWAFVGEEDLFSVAELPLRALWAVRHSLADVGVVDRPDLPAPRRAPALGASEIQGRGLGLGYRSGISAWAARPLVPVSVRSHCRSRRYWRGRSGPDRPRIPSVSVF